MESLKRFAARMIEGRERLFVERLRDELKFNSWDELLVRMGEDVKDTRTILHAAMQG